LTAVPKPSDPSAAPPSVKAFLKVAMASAAPDLRRAAVALVLETLAAVGFAAALAGAVARSMNGLASVAPWLALLAAAGAARGLCGWAAIRLAAGGAARVKSGLRSRVLEAALGARHGRAAVGEISAVAVDEVEALDGYVVRYLPARACVSLGPLIVFGFAALASPIAALLMLTTLVPFIVLMSLAGGAAADASRRQFDALARLSAVFADRVRALPLLLAFQAEATATDQIARSARQVGARTLTVLRIAFVSSAGLEYFAALSVALVAVYAGFRLLGLIPFTLPGKLTFEHAFFVLALAPEFYAPMRRLAAAYHERQLGEGAAHHVQSFLEAASPVASPAPGAIPFSVTAAPAIRFEQVVVGFDDDPDLRIGPVDFEAAPGSITALMGPTGSGKTTLLRLLVGEAALSEGSIIIAGQDLAGAGSIAPVVAWAGQSPALLPGSLGWNIALAAPDAVPSAIRRAAIRAGLVDVLDRRGGLDHFVDERGGGLSGGERRRVGLARAFLKDAPILLLDEPTADLDRDSEAAMIAAIRRAARGRTVLIATHSPALAAIADSIVQL
jgi:ATP-binding cassette subfamily C protein CydD